MLLNIEIHGSGTYYWRRDCTMQSSVQSLLWVGHLIFTLCIYLPSLFLSFYSKFADMNVSLEALKKANWKRAMAKGGDPKLKKAVAKKSWLGPSLGGPSTSTRVLVPRPKEALIVVDDDDEVVVNLASTSLLEPSSLVITTMAIIAIPTLLHHWWKHHDD